jgi:hypothetical protein
VRHAREAERELHHVEVTDQASVFNAGTRQVVGDAPLISTLKLGRLVLSAKVGVREL